MASSYHPELRRCVILFGLTWLCVYYVFGTQWLGGSPFSDLKRHWAQLCLPSH